MVLHQVHNILACDTMRLEVHIQNDLVVMHCACRNRIFSFLALPIMCLRALLVASYHKPKNLVNQALCQHQLEGEGTCVCNLLSVGCACVCVCVCVCVCRC